MHPPRRRRFVATTDSDHDEPVFPDRSRGCEVDGPNQLWVADLTYIAVLGGFVYLAAIMDAWSRRIVGYALGRRIDARLTHGKFVLIFVADSRHAIMVRPLSLGSLRGLGNGFGRHGAAV